MANYSGLWNNEYGENYSPLAQTVAKGNDNTALSKVLANRLYGRAKFRAIIKSLVDGAVGDNATATHKRVQSERDLEANVLGGKRVIETFTAINRNTTSADESEVLAALEQSTKPVYPKDKAGNGGGSKLGW